MGHSAQLQIGGRNYQVVSSASQEELDKLAVRVERALETVGATGSLRAERGLLLAALRLAHDAEEAEAKRVAEKNTYIKQLSHYVDQLNHILGRPTSAPGGRKVLPRKFEVQSIHAQPTAASQSSLSNKSEGAQPEYSPSALETPNPWGDEVEEFTQQSLHQTTLQPTLTREKE